MRVLLAGATGAIGRPLTRALIANGHEVLAVARRAETAQAATALGAEVVRADAMDRDGLLRALDGLRADAVIHELTALTAPKRTLDENDPSTLLRTRGTANLLAAAEILGAGRFLTQSMALGYGYTDHGDRVRDESDPFAVRNGNVADFVIDGLRSTEEQAFAAGHVDGIALRYGLFYGPGTWFDATPGSRPTPVPWNGGGLVPWIHVADAAAATVAALERGSGGQAYNIVDDRPARWGEVAAAARGGRAVRLPGRALRLMVPYFGPLMVDTVLRVSNTRARRELGWTPGYPSYREGLAAARP
ncbi:NAD(P)-dependent oxidoreductase [Nocardia sp. 2]|uniref:NAD(P)-dependent oxidoreductase n=1 Tax=Nocardia acididurans TaxID=2802282 RepID=A0ABS1M1P5_9NOCA|nr:NAD(P)-dependent oxidoreductase [Nocardia acididurans]MBL1074444.1 NAD(P)-dependent oxidoreductase [Nocardia acididurans]